MKYIIKVDSLVPITVLSQMEIIFDSFIIDSAAAHDYSRRNRLKMLDLIFMSEMTLTQVSYEIHILYCLMLFTLYEMRNL